MTALFDAMVAGVYENTKRPDLEARTKQAVKAATLRAHQIDYWDRDLVETGVTFNSSDYYQQLQYSQLFPRWRAVKYLRKYDTTNFPPGSTAGFFNIVTPDFTQDAYHTDKVDIAYLAGEVYQLKSSAAFQNLLIGYYQNPNIQEDGYDSWIAQHHQFAVIYAASRIVFKSIGQDQEASDFDKLAAEQLFLIQTANLQAKGY